MHLEKDVVKSDTLVKGCIDGGKVPFVFWKTDDNLQSEYMSLSFCSLSNFLVQFLSFASTIPLIHFRASKRVLKNARTQVFTGINFKYPKSACTCLS